jgi:hypothetical protein
MMHNPADGISTSEHQLDNNRYARYAQPKPALGHVVVFQMPLPPRRSSRLTRRGKLQRLSSGSLKPPFVRIFSPHFIDLTNGVEINSNQLRKFVAWNATLLNVGLITRRGYQPQKPSYGK